MARIAIRSPACAQCAVSASTKVDLPEPGGPVMPITCAQLWPAVGLGEDVLVALRLVLDGADGAGDPPQFAGLHANS